MNNILLKIVLILVLLSFSQQAFSCRTLVWSAAKYANNSEQVHIGIIYGIKIPELNTVEYPEKTRPMSMRKAILARPNKTAYINVYETLKGQAHNKLEIDINWCGGGIGKLGDIVVIFKLGNKWHVKNTKAAISEAKLALTSRSSGTPQSGAP